MIKKLTIAELADIRFGLYARPEQEGDAIYLQVRQFNDNGQLVQDQDEYINIDIKNESHVLLDGDVLFVAKGNRLFAWCYRQAMRPAVASSIFFVLRPDIKKVYPEFLAAILNTQQSKASFLQIGGGTNIFSIRKSELEAFRISLPSMAQQKKLVALTELHQQQIALAQQLLEQQQQLYTAVISNLIK
jgi:restriction endonuclease S subunit